MHKPLLFARPSLNALATALASMPTPTPPEGPIENVYLTADGYRFNLIPVKTREDGE